MCTKRQEVDEANAPDAQSTVALYCGKPLMNLQFNFQSNAMHVAMPSSALQRGDVRLSQVSANSRCDRKP